jgi:hypothetical protein
MTEGIKQKKKEGENKYVGVRRDNDNDLNIHGRNVLDIIKALADTQLFILDVHFT